MREFFTKKTYESPLFDVVQLKRNKSLAALDTSNIFDNELGEGEGDGEDYGDIFG